MDEYSVILDQARASVAAGRAPNWPVLEERLKAVARKPRAVVDPDAELRALRRLEVLASVHRARARIATSEPVRAPRTRGPVALRERPTITGNMEVRRETSGGAFLLAWDAEPAVLDWTVRVSERSGPRGAYVVREEWKLPAGSTSAEVALGDRALRVHLLGRGRGGKLVRRAVMSPLTTGSWSERWQRRASAA